METKAQSANLVQNWMTPNPITVTSNTSMPEACRIMQHNAIRRLPVVENDKLVGIVTWGDVLEASASDIDVLNHYELNYLLDKLPVKKIMARDPITVTSTTLVIQAAQIMMEHHIGGLPVVDDGKLVGIITESDIFRLLTTGKAA